MRVKLERATLRGTTLFITLPFNVRAKIAGGCDCKYCKNSPFLTPAWDTLAICLETGRTWTVHYPELNSILKTAEITAGVQQSTDSVKALVAALTNLREACEEAYKSGRIPAEPYIAAGNVLSSITHR